MQALSIVKCVGAPSPTLRLMAVLHTGMAAGAHLLSRGEFVHGAWGPTPTRLAQRCPRSLMPLSASAEHRQMRRGPTPDAVAPRLRAPQRLMAVWHAGMAAGAHLLSRGEFVH